MLLTFKVQHDFDFSEELQKAHLVAEFAIKTKSRSSKDVAHIGLKSTIANQVLKKYASNKKVKQVRRVKLGIPGQGIKFKDAEVSVSCLGVKFAFTPHRAVDSIKSMEVDSEVFYVTCEVPEVSTVPTSQWIGVDLNTTGHCAVAANPATGKVIKLGKKAQHTRSKYRAIRKKLQRKGKFRCLKKIKDREQRILTNLDHQISRKLVDTAREAGAGIRMENLSGIRDRAKTSKSFKASLHSWSFNRLQTFVAYKAKLLGVPFELVDPAFTSQADSRTGLLGTRTGKLFVAANGAVSHADVNSAFNIAAASLDVERLRADRDARKRSLTPVNGKCRVKAGKPRTPRL